MEVMDPVEETEPTLCLDVSIGGVADGWRKGLSMVWPRGRTGEGLGGGLEGLLSRESVKASLKTTPCLREPLAVLAFDKALPGPGGMDLGDEAWGDMGPKLWVAVLLCRVWAVGLLLLLLLFKMGLKPVPSCARWSVGSGVTALMVAWGLAEAVGLVRPIRFGVELRRLPAEVLRGRAGAGPGLGPAGEADREARPRDRELRVRSRSRVCSSGTEGREADGRRGRGGGREES